MREWLAGDSGEFAGDDRKVVSVDGREVVVFRWRDRLYALENDCLHMGGPVGEGLLLGRVEAVLDDQRRVVGERFSEDEMHLVCPWHGWEYDIETGACAGLPRRRLRRYQAVEREGRVYVLG
jgi:nitrite reductase (NADH) small subunit